MTKGTVDQSVNLPSDRLVQARWFLRNEQQKHPTMTGLGRSYRREMLGDSESTLAPALAWLGERRNFRPSTKVPGYVSRDGFTFNPEEEERRIALAEDLIRRTDPGPFEDPNYLALLAYQAASIELVWPQIIRSEQIDWVWSRFLLGTAHNPELNAFSRTLPPQDYTVVVVNSALIDFAYQAAKAVIAVLRPIWSTIPGTTVSSKFTKEHIRAELARNPEPIERLYQTLEAYFFTTGSLSKFPSKVSLIASFSGSSILRIRQLSRSARPSIRRSK